MIELGISWKEIIYVTFMAGACWLELRAIRRDIARLEAKVEKHNSFDRRIVKLESETQYLKERLK
jgi:hypothetical protein